MKIRYGLVLAIAIGFGLAGCASGGGGTSAPADVGGSDSNLSLMGENPRDTDNTEAAERALDAAENANGADEARGQFEVALAAAEAAIVEDGRNPLAHRLAAMASMGLEDYEAAGAHFDRAVELRPLYEFDFTSVRENAWIELYEVATPFVQSGDYESAAVHFENANAIYDQRPEAMITLGQIYAQLREHDKALENIDAALALTSSEAMAEVDSATTAGWMEQTAELPLLRAQVLADAGRFEEAVGTYRELSAENPEDLDLKRGLAVMLMEMGEQDDAFALYEEMLGMEGLSAQDQYAIGVGFYRGEDYTQATRAFAAAAETSRNDRDALEMWARSLQLDSAYADVPPVAQRWIELDPNSQNAYLILAQATNLNGDQPGTQQAIQAVEALEVNLSDLQLRRESTGGAMVSGSVINKKLGSGSSVSIQFTFYDNAGSPIGTVSESVALGEADMATVFQIDFASTQMVGGYGYELTIG